MGGLAWKWKAGSKTEAGSGEDEDGAVSCAEWISGDVKSGLLGPGAGVSGTRKRLWSGDCGGHISGEPTAC